jgi:hypothetical protein
MTRTIHGGVHLLLRVILPQMSANSSERYMFHIDVVEKNEIIECLRV